jgi:hypothetical protein
MLHKKEDSKSLSFFFVQQAVLIPLRRRSYLFLAQMGHRLGAGGILGWRPAPQILVLRPTVAQVHTLFPHLRQECRGPAP